MIEIDGSFGEGGGQILRSSIALSCITGKAVRITRIRANRPKPGLAPQHLKGIESAKMLCDAEVEGLKVRSMEVTFRPSDLKPKGLEIDIGTAGSVTLILQSILLPSILRGCRMKIRGGTDVKWAPTVDYFRNVTLKALSELGVRCNFEVITRGYYPKGGGEVVVETEESSLEGVDFNDFKDTKSKTVYGISHCSNLPDHVASRQAKSAERFLRKNGFESDIKLEVTKAYSTGSGITLWSGYKGGSALGEKGKRAENVGQESAMEIAKEMNSKAVFDRHIADQVMVFAALAKGKTSYTTSEITMHQKSNAYVIKQFFGDIIYFDGNRVVIEGVGLLG
ncbi:RNA 3-phosphate cyclase [Archaeoglobus sulfaticallidus PM70-1]|uniref:RNA 3'-terminal phosphate cyclase n=1 Tax=Archaeoglobus sulfaticallidus PM70-1 TaxID=387631 RepID=N0BAY9_9EURY|nr:RNA 3'-terminal phosphate cyclase [Archaeoglobus sulfaticallidus]AGK60774.1 RNA 3-phosphate cyclase [Archaeoglobus sulfaticallidus PM70-1]